MEGEFKINKVICHHHSFSFKELFEKKSEGRSEDEFFNYIITKQSMCTCMSHLVKTREQYLRMLKWYLRTWDAEYDSDLLKIFPDVDEYLTETEICQYMILISKKSLFRKHGGKYRTNINCIKLCLISRTILPEISYNIIHNNPEILFEIEPQYVAKLYLNCCVSTPKENIQTMLAVLNEDTDYMHAYIEACKSNSQIFDKLIEILCESDHLNISNTITCSSEQKKILKEKGYKARLIAGSGSSNTRTSSIDPLPIDASSQECVNYIEVIHKNKDFMRDIYTILVDNDYKMCKTDVTGLAPIISTFNNKYKNLILRVFPYLYPHIGKVTLTTVAFDTKLKILHYCDYKNIKKSTLVSVINKHTRIFVEKYPEILEDKDLVKTVIKYKPHILGYINDQSEYKEDLLRFIKKKTPGIPKITFKDEDIIDAFMYHDISRIYLVSEYIKDDMGVAISVCKHNQSYIKYFDQEIQDVIRKNSVIDVEKSLNNRKKSARK